VGLPVAAEAADDAAAGVGVQAFPRGHW